VKVFQEQFILQVAALVEEMVDHHKEEMVVVEMDLVVALEDSSLSQEPQTLVAVAEAIDKIRSAEAQAVAE
jgi:hypothetical protein